MLNIKAVVRRHLACLVLLPLAALTSLPLSAHTALKASVPASGAVINHSPEELRLEFNGPVQLMKLEVLHMGEHAMELGFKPIAEARTEFVMAVPALSPASYTVNWAVIGEDGHTVSESFSFTVDPAAAVHGGSDGHHAGHAAGH